MVPADPVRTRSADETPDRRTNVDVMVPPFGRGDGPTASFDAYDEFVFEHLPAPGPALQAHEVLEGDAHVAVHRMVREIFEDRGVYDSTFGYNLAKLNLDHRHPDAGFRYAVDGPVLHAEFTPTTAFCPQSSLLTKAAHRALNDLAERHDYDRVEVYVAPMHNHSEAINEELRQLPSEP